MVRLQGGPASHGALTLASLGSAVRTCGSKRPLCAGTVCIVTLMHFFLIPFSETTIEIIFQPYVCFTQWVGRVSVLILEDSFLQ